MPLIFLGSDKMDFQPTCKRKVRCWRSQNSVDQGRRSTRRDAALPFNWSNWACAPVFPSDGKVTITSVGEPRHQKLFEDFGAKPRFGIAGLEAGCAGNARSTFRRPGLELRDVRVAQVEKLEPASFNLGCGCKTTS